MCGIFGFLSSPERVGNRPGTELFTLIAELTRFGQHGAPGIAELPETDRAALLCRLASAQASSYAWVARDAFLDVLEDKELQLQLRETAASLTAWTEQLATFAARGGLTRQADWELVNRLLVGGKDMAWQIDRDLLGSLEPVRALVREHKGSSPTNRSALAHAWQLNLMLSSLNRLEVRGRDSAGIAVYVRFPDEPALKSFLASSSGGVPHREELARRSRLPAFTHGALIRPATAESTLLFAFKVSNEVGKMGDNVAFLRHAIAADSLFQAAVRFPEAQLQALAHTRWASNGVISLPNCHPVDAERFNRAGQPRGRGEIVGVLNGDVDNYQELLARYIRDDGQSIDLTITTDAKIIPLVVGHHYRETGDLLTAFRRAFAEFEGSMAIGVMAADRPGELVFGQKGSGQGLFLGFKDGAVAIASEMYGLVELTPSYVKAEGERVEGGEIFHLVISGRGVETSVCDTRSRRPLPRERLRVAEITTRDINRGDKPHFFLKEISESVESVRKTLRGKLQQGGAQPELHLGSDVVPAKLLDALRSGQVRRILVIGQGTAAVAGEGVAHLLERALARAKPAFQIAPLKATELSGHSLREDMSDTLVVAVSQSGTTTDTNRTVDMVRERGGWVLGIVNRRNSDLVYKSHGVLYTSDGRDIEMSVASTKAFYAQNVAGQILALALASELHLLGDVELQEELTALERLPDAMAKTLALAPEIEKLAERFALARRHWAIVGTGLGKTAANEIRIKLSELCYKSIAVDFLEDKKHIDLSSEPLVIVCANGLPAATVSDVVKEVAIFKAHKSIPLVIADEGETRFDPYAAGTIKVPRSGGLSYLPATAVGHLFGYYAAARFDSFAERLRSIRADVLSASSSKDGLSPESLPAPVTERVKELDRLLAAGGLDAGIEAGTATRLGRVFEALLGWLPTDAFSRHHPSFAEGVIAGLSDAIRELSRPIDAIKHQAKTVTVGISRSEAPATEGALLSGVRGLGLDTAALAESHRRFLAALEPLVAGVEGATLYRVEELDPLGRPTEASTIRILKKTGCAAVITSRSEETRPLTGTKWGVVRYGDIYLGHGKTDGRKILIVPVIGETTHGHLLLYHLDLIPRGRREVRWRALRSRPELLERLQIAVTERNLPWTEALIDGIDNETLFLGSADAVAEELVERATAVR